MKLITNGLPVSWDAGTRFDLSTFITKLHPRLLTDTNKDITDTIYAFKLDGRNQVNTALPGVYFGTLCVYYHYKKKDYKYKQEIELDVNFDNRKRMHAFAPR